MRRARRAVSIEGSDLGYSRSSPASLSVVLWGEMPVKEDLIALFATERNGIRLLSALGKALATYLVDVVGVEDVEEGGGRGLL